MKFVAAIFLSATAVLAAPSRQVAPLYRAAPGVATTGEYIVVLKRNSDTETVLNALSLVSSSLAHVYTGNLKGFARKFDTAALSLIRESPSISYIEEDQNTYYYKNGGGSGAIAYILDTGVYTANTDFGGRAQQNANYVSGSPNTDENGHGTYCAGLIGGAKYGDTKSVALRGVKVLDKNGSGSVSNVIAGVNYAVSDCKNTTPGKCVISFSISGSPSMALKNAVQDAINGGVTVVAGAGGPASDACDSDPSDIPDVIAVGSIDSNYNVASSSNTGPCVDIFAPGVNVKSDSIGSTTATLTASGTTGAACYVAGLATYFLSFGIANSPAAVLEALQKYGQKNLIPNPKGAPNLIANNGYFAGVQ